MRHLPAPALMALMGLAAYGTILALAFASGRGDDFQRLYFSAVNWRRGGDPYAILLGDTPNLNHPILLPVIYLFTLTSPQHAFMVWSMLSLIVLFGCIPAIGRVAQVGSIDLLALALASASSFLAFFYGQVTFLLMALFTAAWYADRRDDATTAGALLGLLSVLKPFFGLFAIYLAWRRQWRAVAAYMAVLAAGALAGVAIAGTTGFLDWVVRLRDVTWRWHIYNASVWGVGDRLFTMHSDSGIWPPLFDRPLVAQILAPLLLVAVTVILWRSIRNANVDCSYALVGLASLLMSPLGWLYYLPIFWGPIIAVLSVRPSRWLLVLVALSVWPYLLLVGPLRGTLGALIIGDWAFATVAALFLTVAAAGRALDDKPCQRSASMATRLSALSSQR